MRRKKILSAACTLLQQQGYHHTTMDDIARQTGMSKKTLYRLFPSKKSLLEELLSEELFTPLILTPSPSLTLEEQLQELIIQSAKILLSEKRLCLLRIIIEETNRSPSIQKMMTDLVSLSGRKSGIKQWLEQHKNSGHLNFPNLNDATDHLFGMTLGGIILSRLGHCAPPRNTSEMENFIKEGVKIFLNNYRIKPND